MNFKKLLILFSIFFIIIPILIALIFYILPYKKSSSLSSQNNLAYNIFLDNNSSKTKTKISSLDTIYAFAFKNKKDLVALHEDGSESFICSLDSDKYLICDYDNNNIYLIGEKNNSSIAYKIDLTKTNYNLELVCNLHFDFSIAYNSYINTPQFMNNVRYLRNSYIVQDNVLYYYDTSNQFKKYNILTNTEQNVLEPYQENYGPFNNSYYNKKYDYIFSSKYSFGNFYDIFRTSIGTAERIELDKSSNYHLYDYHILDSIPINNNIYGIYVRNNSQEINRGILKLDLENNDLTEMITLDKNLSFAFSYNNNIYLIDHNEKLYEYDSFQNTINEISFFPENANFSEYETLIKCKLNIDYIIDIIAYKHNQVMTFSSLEYSSNNSKSKNNSYDYEILYSIDLKNNNKIIKKDDLKNIYDNVLYIK